ncbi:MAG TPA: winged helix-turn-helix domain-containing protein [Vicinamibacterales bacterium]|nr:winged helix-turn-helix domain-containing protein [Vicinamibacterales bacterium]
MVTYRFGPFRLVLDQRLLERDGTPVALTAKAFDLLAALVQQRTRALSKDELLALVWPGSVVEEGNLSQQVFVLRRTLADAGECVATVPRHGYRFVATVVEEHENHSPAKSPHCIVWDGREYPLREGVTVIGRAEDADLRIPLPSLSRHHARVIVRGLAATLEDLGSRHGSWRGSLRVRDSVGLSGGDEIRLGTAMLVYYVVMPNDTTRD